MKRVIWKSSTDRLIAIRRSKGSGHVNEPDRLTWDIIAQRRLNGKSKWEDNFSAANFLMEQFILEKMGIQ